MTVTEMANYALKKQDYEKATSKQGSSDSEGNQSISDLERSYRNAEATGGDRWLCDWNPDVEPKHIVPLSKDIEDLVKHQIRERYLKEQGGSSFEKVHSYNEKYKAYSKTRNGPERMSVLYTIEELKFSEMDKIMGYIKSKVPGWHHPKPYDPAIVQEYINQEEGKDNKDINISV